MAEQYDLSMNGMMHRAFLRDLGRISHAVHTDRWDAARRRWELIAGILHHHHRTEDEHLWPAMLARITDPADRATVEAMEAEHEQLAAAILRCANDFAGGRPASAPERAAVAADVDLLAETLRGHTEHEEAQGEPLIAKYVTPEEFTAFVKAARTSPDRMVVIPWIADGAAPQDVVKAWGLIPKPVRFLLKPRMERQYLARIAG